MTNIKHILNLNQHPIFPTILKIKVSNLCIYSIEYVGIKLLDINTEQLH